MSDYQLRSRSKSVSQPGPCASSTLIGGSPEHSPFDRKAKIQRSPPIPIQVVIRKEEKAPTNETGNDITQATNSTPSNPTEHPSTSQAPTIIIPTTSATTNQPGNKETEVPTHPIAKQKVTPGTMNTTITDALAATRQAAVPQFLCPPTFHPAKGTATNFINSYERAAAANGWDDQLKIAYFQTFLDGAASLWFQQYSQRNGDKTWSDICVSCKKEFDDTSLQLTLKKKAEQRKQTEEETVKNFFYDLKVLYHEYKNIMDFEEFKGMFEQGLHEGAYYHYYWLTNHPNKPPSSEEELKTLAITIDNAPDEKRNKQATSRPPFGEQTQQRALYPPRPQYQHYTPREIYRPRSQPSRTRDRDRDRPICYNCGKPGHFAYVCRSSYHPNGGGRLNH